MFNILIKILNCLAFFLLLKRVKFLQMFLVLLNHLHLDIFWSSHMSLKTKHRMTLLLRGPRISTWELSFLIFVSLEACTVSRTPLSTGREEWNFSRPRNSFEGLDPVYRVVTQNCHVSGLYRQSSEISIVRFNSYEVGQYVSHAPC